MHTPDQYTIHVRFNNPLTVNVDVRNLFWLTPNDFIQQSEMAAPLWVNCQLGQPVKEQEFTSKF